MSTFADWTERSELSGPLPLAPTTPPERQRGGFPLQTAERVTKKPQAATGKVHRTM
jgi:hypothetical protein